MTERRGAASGDALNAVGRSASGALTLPHWLYALRSTVP